MSAERQIPAGVFVNETTNNQEQIPAAQFIVDTGGSVAVFVPTFFLNT